MTNFINTIKEIINTFNNSEMFLACLALLVSSCALAWNITRDLIIDKPRLKLKVEYGGLLPVVGSSKSQFIPINEGYNVEIKSKGLLFNIVNIGKREVVINAIGGNYKILDILRKKSKKHIGIVCKELPVKVKPFAVFNKFNKNDILIKELMNDKIACLWVQDVEGKKWKMSNINMRKLIKKLKLEI